MIKLSKQDKIEIYQLWHSYGAGIMELSQRYRVRHSNISYLLALLTVTSSYFRSAFHYLYK